MSYGMRFYPTLHPSRNERLAIQTPSEVGIILEKKILMIESKIEILSLNIVFDHDDISNGSSSDRKNGMDGSSSDQVNDLKKRIGYYSEQLEMVRKYLCGVGEEEFCGKVMGANDLETLKRMVVETMEE